MSKKNIKSTLYMSTKLSWNRKNFVVEEDPNGYLFPGGRYRTKILPEDLPEWYVSGYMYKRRGYMLAKGVRHLFYIPNYTYDNHLHKYDSLFISYDKPIEPYRDERGTSWYNGYGEILSGSMIVAFVKAVGKYSDYDVSKIQKEILRKREFYYERNPEQTFLKE